MNDNNNNSTNHYYYDYHNTNIYNTTVLIIVIIRRIRIRIRSIMLKQKWFSVFDSEEAMRISGFSFQAAPTPRFSMLVVLRLCVFASW